MISHSDLADAPIILFRVGWMDRYQGLGGDRISGGGAYVAENGFGSEIFNYRRYRGFVYGYVQPPAKVGMWEQARINLRRLGAAPTDGSLSGVLAVWVATAPGGGAYVVGWHRNATVFRDRQDSPAGADRKHGFSHCGYYVRARADDAVLLPPDERVCPVPQGEKGAFGQSNVWYASASEAQAFRRALLRFIESRQLTGTGKERGSAPVQPDPLLRQRVEQAAIECTSAHFTNLGYAVSSVERDNVGWDLNAVVGRRTLRLEVKGLSGPEILLALTPNEYRALRERREAYRVCTVTEALTAPALTVFAYSPDSGEWQSSDGRVLRIEELVAARCSAA